MSKYLIDEETLTDIASAIREKNGTSNGIDAAKFAEEIGNISQGVLTDGDMLNKLFKLEGDIKRGSSLILNTYPVEHEMRVKLTGDGVDLSNVKLIKTGLNMWDEQWELGTILNSGVNSASTTTIRSKNYIPVKANVKYGIYAPQMSRVVLYDTSKAVYNYLYPSARGSFTPTKDGYVRFAIGAVGDTPNITEYDKNICIGVYDSFGSQSYEPYVEPIEYQAEAGGVIKGVTSLYPVTTLYTNADNVVIECEYLKKSRYDEFWDAFQNYGNTVLYGNSPFNRDYWTDQNFNPKYTIVPHGSTFYQCGIVDNAYTDKIDFSQATNLEQSFRNAKIRKLKKVDTRNCNTSDYAYYYTFGGCGSLESIDEFYPPTKEGGGVYLFAGCYKLSHIIFCSEIKLTSFDLRDCKLLDRESLDSIMDNLSPTTSGLTVTFSKVAIDKAYETNEGANDGSASEEWENKVAAHTNWVIVLN